MDAQGNPQTLKALNNVSYTALKGTMNAIIGTSGSGKSSLLSVAATLIRPTSGSVALDGVDLTSLKDSERTKLRAQKIGIIFQQPNLIASLTAEEQL